VNKLVDELGPRFKTRPGGFTRMVRLGQRRGDNAMMVRLELVERPEAKEVKENPILSAIWIVVIGLLLLMLLMLR